MPINPKFFPKTPQEILQEHLAESDIGRLAHAIASPKNLPTELLKPRMISPPTPKETNEFQSAGVLLRGMSQAVQIWRRDAPKDSQPVIVAILNGG